MKITCQLLVTLMASVYVVYGQKQPSPIYLTAQDVVTNSVVFFANPTKTKETVGFHFAHKTSAEIEAIAHRHPQAKIMRDGIVVVESVDHGCVGLLGGPANTNYVGLVLYFDNYDKAELAAKSLQGN